MTAYQTIVRAHLVAIFKKNNAVTVDIVLQAAEKEFVTKLCLEHGYVPTFSITMSGYTTMNAIKMFLC